jgi:hypothetical protein
MKHLILILALLCGSIAFSQFDPFMDTIKLDATPLSKLDSADIRFAEFPSTFVGGLSVAGPDLNASNIVSRINNRWLVNAFQRDHRDYFSALPYLGFTYSFGAQGTQFLTTRFTQAFTDSLILNINYRRSSGNGYFRNSVFDRNNVRASFIKKGKFYSFYAEGIYASGNYQHAGGLSTDSLIETFGLEFSPVSKGNADSKIRNGEINLKNYFDFIPSANIATGLAHRTRYSIVNRKYNEVDTLGGIYPIVNFNSDTTADQYNLASISNFGGLFIQRNGFYFDGGVEQTFWRYQNLSSSLDTVEIGLTSGLRMSFKSFELLNDFKFNLIGAFNAWSNHAQLYTHFRSFKVTAWMNVGQYALDAFRRNYLANTFQYATTGSLKEFKLDIGGEVSARFIGDKILLSAGLRQIASPDLYVFNGDRWQNDSLNNVSVTSVSLAPAINLNHFKLNTKFVYNLSNTSFVPQFQLFSRIYFTGKMFEAKILKFAAGVDFRYNSNYSVMAYVPGLDVASQTGNSIISSARTNLDAFINLGLGKFGFYFRFENIAYFWEDQLRQVAENYPIAGPRMRLGITWDFFN